MAAGEPFIPTDLGGRGHRDTGGCGDDSMWTRGRGVCGPSGSGEPIGPQKSLVETEDSDATELSAGRQGSLMTRLAGLKE